MVDAVSERWEEDRFERANPELSAEAALLIWVIAGYPVTPDPVDEPKTH